MIPRRLWRYLANLSTGRMVLWFYFIWWSVVLVRYFNPDPRLWLTSVGLSLLIGLALFINTTASGTSRLRLEPWPTFRLFVTPFCVSSFSALVKGKGFFLIFSPNLREMGVAAGLCFVLWGASRAAKATQAAPVGPKSGGGR